MFLWYYPMDGLYTYRMGTAMGRLLMDMKAQVPQQHSEVYYAVIDGESKGPYSFDELRGLVRDGKVGRDTFLWTQGMERWQLAADLAQVRPLVCVAPPPLPNTNEETETP